MLKQLLLLLIISKAFCEGCDIGCLACSSSNTCLFCDPVNKYYLDNHECVLADQQSCLLVDQFGGCLLCDQSFYIDPATLKCLQVDLVHQVVNCAGYNSNQACEKCATGYYLSNNSCAVVGTPVSNCEVYSADGVCALCADGFIFNAQRNGCVAPPALANCASFSFIGCQKCATGYLANQNLYFDQLLGSAAAVQAEISSEARGSLRDWKTERICQKFADPNCLAVGAAFDQCVQCAAGFFLTPEKACQAFPLQGIEGCLKYSALTSCKECQPGMFLESAAKCTLVAGDKLIDNCAAYDPAASTAKCTQCSSDRFLVGNTCSGLRASSLNIARCLIVSLDADNCAQCQLGFVLTNDSAKCLDELPNCASYQPSTQAASALTCLACKPGFFLQTDQNGTSCLPGQIEGCLTYQSETQCAACDTSQYFLNNQICTKHVAVANCLVYSDLVANQCATCAQGYYPFTLATVCSPISAISKCTSYQSPVVCAACAPGYRLLNNGCQSLAGLLNCPSVGASGVCQKYLSGSALTSAISPACLQVNNLIINQCALLTPNPSAFPQNPSANIFLICSENFAPYELGGMDFCFVSGNLSGRGVSSVFVIPDCKRYANDPTHTCLQCSGQNGKVVVSANGSRICGNCNPSAQTNVLDPLDGSVDVCVPYANAWGLQDCETAVRVHTGTAVESRCIKYRSPFLPVVSGFNPDDNGTFYKDIPSSSVPSSPERFLYLGFELSAHDAPENRHTSSEAASDCELFYFDAGKVVCWRCKWGFASLVTFAASVPSSVCTSIDDCDKQTFYAGFSARLNQLLSCHKCSNGKALLVSAEGAQDNSFSISGPTDSAPVVQCLSTNSPGFFKDGNNNIIANCQVHVLLGAVKGCVACAPGFKPVPANPGDRIFTACAAIADCDAAATTNVLADRCGRCKQTDTQNSPAPKAFADSGLQSCLSVSTANCLFVDQTLPAAAGVYTCKICLPGFYLNEDKVCDKISLPNCLDSSSNLLKISTVSKEALAQYYMAKALSGLVFGRGCASCADGYTAVTLLQNERQCVGSANVLADAYPSGSALVPGCASYKNSFDSAQSIKYTCSACRPGKIPVTSGKACVTSVPNCLAAQNGQVTLCQTCQPDFANLSGQCFVKNIANCRTYDTLPSGQGGLQCAQCFDGFYITAEGGCFAGNIANCAVYVPRSPNGCAKCAAGFNVLATSQGLTYCLRMPEASSCLSAKESGGLQEGLFDCASCRVSDALATWPTPFSSLANASQLPKTLCVPLEPVEHCATFDAAAATVGVNSFLCSACQSGFFLDTSKNACVARTNQPPACVEFYVDKDACQTCNDSSVKKPDETDCLSLPSGIVGCASYSSATDCASCVAPRFLSNNACLPSTAVPNCAAYQAESVCAACQPGFFLAGPTSCQLATAQGCFTFASISACASCDPADPGKGLKPDSNGVVNCVDKNLANCESSNDQFPFVCDRCKTGFFVDDGGLCAPADPIAHCQTFASKSSCAACQQGFLLALDRLSCLDGGAFSLEANCAQSAFLADPICSRCSPGYYFVNNACTGCSQNSYASGCFSCNPHNETVCLACRPQFYMTQDGSCHALTGLFFETTTNSTSGAEKFKEVIIVLILLLLNKF